MKIIISASLVISIMFSCNKTVKKNSNTLIGIYTSVDANLFYKAFSVDDRERWIESTLILKIDSTYVFETEEIINTGYWKIIDKENIKFNCSLNIEKFCGKVYNQKIMPCKTDIPILLFSDNEILYENRKDQFEYVTKRP